MPRAHFRERSEYIDSPATEIHDGATEVRGNLERDPSLGRNHAVYDEMRAKGLTDYAALSWLKTIPRRGEAPQLCRDSGLAFARAGDFSNWRRPMNGMGMEFARVISPVEDMEIWNASSNGFSFVISYESHSGPGLHGRNGFVASWRPIHQNRCAIKVGGSPFESLTEAEEACKAMLGHLTR